MDKFDINLFLKKGNLFLIPPYIKVEDKNRIITAWEEQHLDDHVFMLSSGTTSASSFKTYALSKSAIRNNAIGVNQFLDAGGDDTWLSSLPFYHIGGLSIFVRANESNSKVVIINSSWKPRTFYRSLTENNVTYTSLVPTQLYDVIEMGFICPKNVKGVFVGGDFLSSDLKMKALSLGWPVIVTYGMTETGSQVASGYERDLIDGFIPLLSGQKIINKNNDYVLKSKSLFSKEIIINEKSIECFDCGENFILKDRLDLKEVNGIQYLRPLGRLGDEFKLKGRLFNFLEIRDIAESVFLKWGVFKKASIKLVKDTRDGNEVILLVEEDIINKINEILEDLNKCFPPAIKITKYQIHKNLPRTELGKLKKS